LNNNGELVSISTISERQGISQPYLEQIFNKLKKDGIVLSKPGPGGGYSLAKDPSDLTIGDIIRSLEGSLAPVKCVSENEADASCPRMDICATRLLWQKLGDDIERFFDSITVDQLKREAEASAKKPKAKSKL